MTNKEHEKRELLANQNYENAVAELVLLYGEDWGDEPEELIAEVWTKHHFLVVPTEVKLEEIIEFDPKIRYLR